MNLRPQDVVVVLKVTVSPAKGWTFPLLAAGLHLSVSEAHAAVGRALRAGLLFRVDPKGTWPRPSISAFLEFAIHGVRYAFPPDRQGMARGVPTAVAAPVLQSFFAPSSEPPPVWPHADGKTWGASISPLYPGAVAAALEDERLYAGLALIDALRIGGARERGIAETELRKLVDGGGGP